MRPEERAAALELLWKGAVEGSFRAEEVTGELDLDEGLALQLELLGRWESQGEKLAGWKVGMTSGAARDALGPGFRPFGFILASRVRSSGATVRLGEISICGVEAELCFRIGRSLGGERVTPDQAKEAVAAVAPGFEINELRPVGSASGPLRVADNLAQWGIVVGDERSPVPEDLDFAALRVEMFEGESPVASTLARDHIDDPYLSIARLARQLTRFGRRLEPSQRVITGAYSRHAVSEAGGWQARFSDIGSVAIRFA